MVGVAPAEAFADPSPSTGHSSTGSTTIHGSGAGKATLGKATFRRAGGVASPSVAAEDSSVCDIYDVHGNWTAYYTDDVITDAETTFGSSITCTPPPGQLMAALHTQATLWHNAQPAGSTRGSGCGTCNHVATADVTVLCVAAACPGSYWVSADQLMQLPAGYVWSSWPSSCVTPLPQTPDVLECYPLTTTWVISPTYP